MAFSFGLAVVSGLGFVTFAASLFNDHPALPGWNKTNGNLLNLQDDLDFSEDTKGLQANHSGGLQRPKRSARVKRATGTSMEDVIFSMTEIASQSLGGGNADIGDSFTYNVAVDLPDLSAEATDIKMEIFAIEPTTGIAGFSICQSTEMVSNRGDQVTVSTGPIYKDVAKADFPTVVEKAVIDWTNVQTTGPDGTDKNTINVQFQAMMVPLPELENGKKYYVSAGIEYAEEAYVWVGQIEVTASLSGSIYNAEVTMSDPPTTLAKGDADLIKIDAKITNPAGDIKFVVSQPLGYTEVFHFGDISYAVGDAFACSDAKHWKASSTKSSTGMSNSRYYVEYPFLINRDAKRDVSDPINQLTFKVPVQVLNSDTVMPGLSRDLSFGLYIGTTKLWTALHTVTITAPIAITEGAVSAASATIANTGDIEAGDGVAYLVSVTVPPGWVDFDVVVDGGTDFTAAAVNVVNAGTVAYIPPQWAVEVIAGTTLNVNFGSVKNADDADTTVVLAVAFNTAKTITAGSYTPTTLTVGGVSAAPGAFTVIDNSGTNAVSVIADPFGLDAALSSKFYVGGQVGMSLLVTVPGGSGVEDLTLAAVTDFDITAFSVRICRIQITQVGKNVPCIGTNNETEVFYNKTEDTRPYDDYGFFPVGPTCPVNVEGSAVEDNQFRANFVFELPPQSTITAETMKLSGGLKIDDSTIWVSSGTYTTETSSYGGPLVTGDPSGVTTPFFTEYPYVTSKDRPSDVYAVGEGLFVKYLLKLPPQTFGRFTVTITPGPKLKVCRLVLTHVGDHYPCTQMPGSSATGGETTVWGFSGEEYAVDTDVAMTFQGLTNWGRAPMVPDLTVDDDSIQIVVFFKVEVAGTGAEEPINYKLDYGDQELTGLSNVKISADTITFTDDKPLTLAEYKSLSGENDKIYKGASKLMQFKLQIPKDFNSNFVFSLENKNFDDDKHVFFCTMAIVAAGNNLPCIIPFSDETRVEVLNATGQEKLYNDETVYSGIKMTVEKACYIPYSLSPADSQLTIEVAVRVKDDVPADDIVTLTAKVSADAATGNLEYDVPLTVKDWVDGVIDVTTVVPEDAKVLIPADNVDGVYIGIAERVWVPFIVQMPPGITTKMEASVLMPSLNERPIIHLRDVKFAESQGKNVVCMDPHIDLQRNFDTTWFQTSNVTTFMSMDTATVDLGYVTNAGFTRKWGGYKPEDDQFSVQMELQMSDHVSTAHDAEFEIFFAVKFGSTIVVSSQLVKVNRTSTPATRKTIERGNIIVDVNQTMDTSVLYNATDTLNFEAVIYHNEDSKAEGYPTRIRVIAPNYVYFVDGTDTFVTNYTQGGVSTNMVTKHNTTESTIIDFEFPGGLLFPDVVSLNFSMTVDPLKERPTGSGEAATAVVFHPICQQSEFFTWPPADTYAGCGSMTAEPFISLAAECYDPIPLAQVCQVRASSQMDDTSAPYNALSSTLAWSPALRTGKGWREYLLFDFLAVARLNWVKVGTPKTINGKSYRVAADVIIETSNVASSFNFVKKQIGIPPDNTIKFGPIEARYAKLIIIPTYDNPEASPVAVNEVQFFGCLPDAGVTETCDPVDNTIMANSATQYRHFAVDTTTTPEAKKIIYFCDRNPYREGMFCYCSDRLGEPNTWSELPRYVGYIEGFSPLRGRMYFRDSRGTAILSSYNCKDVELTDALPADIQPAVNVPGIASTAVTDVTWPADTTIKGDFKGLYDGTVLLVQWQTCCDGAA